jgi:hypothetical protein
MGTENPGNKHLGAAQMRCMRSVHGGTLKILWHVDPLLGDNRETSNYTAAADK